MLLTPDDIWGEKRRARQNVILELGYFVGRLGRPRVCALHKPDVEMPSDWAGVVYVALDEGGAWRLKLAQELVSSKFDIQVEKLLS